MSQDRIIANSIRSSMRPGAATTTRFPMELPLGFHEDPLQYISKDLPPAYTSLTFPSQTDLSNKDYNINSDSIERPPSYRSVFIVRSPPTPVEVT
jgi:hypothetical protein